MWETWGDEVQFYVVYIREAHAIDSRSPLGGFGNPIVEDPKTQDERDAVAQVCMTKLEMEELPSVVDGMDDAVNQAYGGWPDRLYLVDVDGKVAYKGGRGPFGFTPNDLEDAIREALNH